MDKVSVECKAGEAAVEVLPGVEIQELPGRGRGLVTTTAIAAGTLVVLEPAIAAIELTPSLMTAPAVAHMVELAVIIIGLDHGDDGDHRNHSGAGALEACAGLEPKIGEEHAGATIHRREIVRGRKMVEERLRRAGTVHNMTAVRLNIASSQCTYTIR